MSGKAENQDWQEPQHANKGAENQDWQEPRPVTANPALGAPYAPTDPYKAFAHGAWISVRERMPEPGQSVLVCGPRCPVMESRRTQGWGRNAHRTYWAGCAQATEDYITHWMPMPSRPVFPPEPTT